MKIKINDKLIDKNIFSISGKWTPRVEGTTIAGTTSYLLQQGDYVIVGGLLILSFKLGFNGLSGGSGNIKITGWEDLADLESGYFATSKVLAEGTTLFANNLTTPYQIWVSSDQIILSKGNVGAIAYQNVSTNHYIYGNIYLKISNS